MSKDANSGSEKSKKKENLSRKDSSESLELVGSDDELVEPSVARDEPHKRGRKSKQHHDRFADSLLLKTFKKLTLQSPFKPLKEPTFQCFIDYFRDPGFENIITLSGAGISTAAGVPDFRTPIHGLYDKLNKYNLPYPQAIFEYSYFLENPEPFFDLAKQLIPGTFQPTISHYFIKLLEQKDILLRHYTQNIDGLDRLAGISEELLIEAHGSFYTSHCLKCNKEYVFDWVKEQIMDAGVPRCVLCNEVVKPDIVFFGENLPRKFTDNIKIDFPKADLLIILGSSLVVEPFASTVNRVHRNCPRVIINNEEVGKNVGLVYDARRNERDIFLHGTCDDGCMKIVNEMKWTEEFNQFVAENKKG